MKTAFPSVSLRGKRVHILGARFGVQLHAAERGYCPFSSTGFRSLPGVTAVDAFLLEQLAADDDGRRRQARRALSGAFAEPTAAHQTGFIVACQAIDEGVTFGLWSDPTERGAFWGLAHNALATIAADPAFQPTPNGGIWTEAFCAERLHRAAQLREALAAALRGEPAALRARGAVIGLEAYLDLPVPPVGEPIIDLPAHTGALGLDLTGHPAIAIKAVNPAPRGAFANAAGSNAGQFSFLNM